MRILIFGLTLLASLFFVSPALAYTVQSGDTMTEIAQKFDLSLKQLSEMNPNIDNVDLIFIGQEIHTDIQVEAQTSEKKEIGKVTANPEPKVKAAATSIENTSFTVSELDLLARLVSAEAKSEPFEGKVAVACVVLNRLESPKFPKTIRDVIYQSGQFQPVRNGAIHKPADEDSIKAVQAALTDQRHIAAESLFFYNPTIATSRWLDSRATTTVIGHHVFKK